MSKLANIIQEKIATRGPLSFRDFMGMALYYPGLGYYTSGGERIGKQGDYYTCPSDTPLLGEMIAKQLVEMWDLLDRGAFALVEYGAGNGTLCTQILSWLYRNSPLFDDITYYMIEKKAGPVTISEKRFKTKIIRIDSIQDIPPVSGCILSNELLDNFPVHRIVMDGELKELKVSYTKDGFVETPVPADKELKKHINELKMDLPEQGHAEVCMDMVPWISEVAAALHKGFVLTIDYGDTKEGLLKAYCSDGTLHCYHKHQISRNPYHYIGQQDITADVNFSALAHWGKKAGLEYTGLTSQTYFMLALGLCTHITKHDRRTEESDTDQLLQLFMHMGRKQKVMIQHKGICNPVVSGLQFSHRAVA